MLRLLHKISRAFYRHNDELNHHQYGAIFKQHRNRAAKLSIQQLTHFIYNYYYCTNRQYHRNTHQTIMETDERFQRQLSHLFKDAVFPDFDWNVKNVIDDAILLVTKGGITLTITKNKHLPEKERKRHLKEGDVTAILCSCHFPNVSPGFYLYKSLDGSMDFNKKVVRIYFNVHYRSAISFVEQLLEKLYSNSFSFQFKIAKELKRVHRADSAVLYFYRNDFEKIWNAIIPWLVNHPSFLKKTVSPFHYKIIPGAGLAEEPEIKREMESYGLHRSRILAEAIYHLFFVENRKKISKTDLLAAFQDEGLNVHEIYLNPGSTLNAKLKPL
jgi:HopA1 effector protein family